MAEKFNLEEFPISESALRMMSYVSKDFYEKSYVGKWLFQVMGLEYDEARKLVEELPYQMFVETATWGLMYHELKWQLPIRNNLSYEERRKLIYQKRDYRNSITPYQMELYLKNATSFNVFVADCHDKGIFNYEPQHPNEFKVFLTGEGTLDIKSVVQMINKLKQSHTTYTINNYSNFVIDNSNLEKIFLSNINIALKILFWRVRFFDGSELMDGTHLMDSAREYDLRLGIMYQEGRFEITENQDVNEIVIRAKSFLFEKVIEGKQTIGIKVDMWWFLCFKLKKVTSIDPTINVKLKALSISERVENITVTSRRNLAYFDGLLRMDGSRLMNSINKKEVI